MSGDLTCCDGRPTQPVGSGLAGLSPRGIHPTGVVTAVSSLTEDVALLPTGAGYRVRWPPRACHHHPRQSKPQDRGPGLLLTAPVADLLTYSPLHDRIRALLPDRPEPDAATVVVVIAGHGGAGKSTLARRLSADLGGQVVAGDCLYAHTDTRRAGLFNLHDWDELDALLRSVRRREERLRYRTRGYDGATGAVDVARPGLVIVEGIRLLRPEVATYADLCVWIEATPEEAGARAKVRNAAQGDSLGELALWDSKWIPEGHEYEQQVRPRDLADVVYRADDPSTSAAGSAEETSEATSSTPVPVATRTGTPTARA